MRIGFFSEVYYPKTDGVVVSIETFRRELEKLGHEVYIFAPAPSLRYKETDPRVIRFPGIKGLGFDEYITKWPWTPGNYKKAKNLKLDVVHSHTPTELGIFGMAVALKEGIPLVTTYHTDYYSYAEHYTKVLPGVLLLSQMLPFLIGQPERYRDVIGIMRPEKSASEWSRKAVRTVLPLQLNLCDAVVAPSVKIEKQLLGWKVKTPITILPTGVDPVTTDDAAIAEFKKQWGIKPTDRVVMFVGRTAGEKNIELLIKSFDKMAAKNAHAKLLIVGDDSYRPNLVKLAKTLPSHSRIIFTGYVTDRRQLGAAYASSHVFAFPSMTDTQGLSIHEAACAGLPIVMTDRQITDVVKNKVNGFYATNSVNDFAAKLGAVLVDDSLQRKMGQESRQLAEAFSASEQARKLLSLYQQVIQEHHSEPQDFHKSHQRQDG